MPKQPPSCILEKWKFYGQKFLESLRAEEQYREGKNKMSTSVDTLLFLTISHRKEKTINIVWKDDKCKILKVGKAIESDKILFLLTCPEQNFLHHLSKWSCVWQLTDIKWHVLPFFFVLRKNIYTHTCGSNLIYFYTLMHRFLKIRQSTWSISHSL